MSNTEASPPNDPAKRRGIFADLKLDFASMLAVNIFGTFALVILCNAIFKTAIDADLKQVLITIVTLMVGFYFGSSAGSKDANQTVKQLALTPVTPPNGPKP